MFPAMQLYLDLNYLAMGPQLRVTGSWIIVYSFVFYIQFIGTLAEEKIVLLENIIS